MMQVSHLRTTRKSALKAQRRDILFFEEDVVQTAKQVEATPRITAIEKSGDQEVGSV